MTYSSCPDSCWRLFWRVECNILYYYVLDIILFQYFQVKPKANKQLLFLSLVKQSKVRGRKCMNCRSVYKQSF